MGSKCFALFVLKFRVGSAKVDSSVYHFRTGSCQVTIRVQPLGS